MMLRLGYRIAEQRLVEAELTRVAQWIGAGVRESAPLIKVTLGQEVPLEIAGARLALVTKSSRVIRNYFIL